MAPNLGHAVGTRMKPLSEPFCLKQTIIKLLSFNPHSFGQPQFRLRVAPVILNLPSLAFPSRSAG